jgi:hypothetical protein
LEKSQRQRFHLHDEWTFFGKAKNRVDVSWKYVIEGLDFVDAFWKGTVSFNRKTSKAASWEKLGKARKS